MTKNDYLIAKALKKRLSDMVELVDFRVFGSRARGNSFKDSDMDVFIEVESVNKSIKKKIHDIVWEVGFENDIFISPLIFSRYEIEDSPLRSAPIVININKEGVKL